MVRRACEGRISQPEGCWEDIWWNCGVKALAIGFSTCDTFGNFFVGWDRAKVNKNEDNGNDEWNVYSWDEGSVMNDYCGYKV